MNDGLPDGNNKSATLRQRRRLGLKFAGVIVALYFGFSVALAFFPHFLAIGAPYSIGFGLIVALMAAIVILNALYMNIADEKDERRGALTGGGGE